MDKESRLGKERRRMKEVEMKEREWRVSISRKKREKGGREKKKRKRKEIGNKIKRSKDSIIFKARTYTSPISKYLTNTVT